MTDRPLSPVLEAEIIKTGKAVVSIDTQLKDFLKRQTHVENRLDDHDKRIRVLENGRTGDRRFVSGVLFVMSSLAAVAVAVGKYLLGI